MRRLAELPTIVMIMAGDAANRCEAAKESPIFARFPERFDLTDEFYWELRGDAGKITSLVTSPAGPAIATKPLPGPPKIEDHGGQRRALRSHH